MAISFECKNCGGELEIVEEGIGRCTSCRTRQPIPKKFDEKYNRANKYRRENANFDEAARLYDSIIDENPDEAEAYWGRVLCRYGIEEVMDRDGDYKPTCHRTIEKSIMDDVDFKLACEHADNAQNLEYYKQQAEHIDVIQRKILSIVKNEDPYDIFISFKDKDDETRNETEDSKAANVLYNELVLKGYKVFFSKVTLRDKLGEDYEPYIYAALKSAKVMILVGTKKEYMQAKWVRNEWRRFNDMRLKGDRKKIIVAIKGMSEEDVPYELNTMQFAKLDSMTFLEDVKKNIDNFLGEAIEKRKEREAQQQMEQFMASKGIFSDSDKAVGWYENAMVMLRSGRFTEANRDFSEAIKINPRYSAAFWGRLLAKNMIKDEELLRGMTLSFENDDDYIRAVNFATDEERIRYSSFVQACRENHKKEMEGYYFIGREQYKKGHFNDAIASLNTAIKGGYESADAYWCRLLASKSITEEGVKSSILRLSGTNDYRAAMRLASPEEKQLYEEIAKVCEANFNIANGYRVETDKLDQEYRENSKAVGQKESLNKFNALYNKYRDYLLDWKNIILNLILVGVYCLCVYFFDYDKYNRYSTLHMLGMVYLLYIAPIIHIVNNFKICYWNNTGGKKIGILFVISFVSGSYILHRFGEQGWMYENVYEMARVGVSEFWVQLAISAVGQFLVLFILLYIRGGIIAKSKKGELVRLRTKCIRNIKDNRAEYDRKWEEIYKKYCDMNQNPAFVFQKIDNKQWNKLDDENIKKLEGYRL